MRNRLAAAVGAIVLIGAALLLRGALGGDDGDGGSASGSGASPVVGCSPDLTAICDALAADGLIAADPPTIALDVSDLAGTSADDPVFSGRTEDGTRIDGWIALRPSAAIANDPNGEPTWAPGIGLAGAPIGVAARKQLATCHPTISWECVAADPAGIATGDPTTVDGLLRLLPFRRTFAPDDDAKSKDLLRKILEERSQSGDRFERDRSTMLSAPGAYRILVGPTSDLVGHSRLGGGVVDVPDGSPGFVVALHPRPGAADAAWTKKILGRAHDALEAESTGDDRLAEAFSALGVESLDDESTDPDPEADDALAIELLQLEGLVNP